MLAESQRGQRRRQLAATGQQGRVAGHDLAIQPARVDLHAGAEVAARKSKQAARIQALRLDAT